MNTAEARWVLAFDALCGTCRQISAAVSRASEGKLEVLPLTNADVREWRDQALGANPASVPTLVKAHGAEVRAWTGAGMTVPLVRRLGPRSTLRVLQALGELRRQASHPLEQPSSIIGRKAFLRIGAGALVAVGMVVAGKTPAFAEKTRDAARAWVQANKGRLPEEYDVLIQYPLEYRRAIHRELTPAARSRVWLDQLTRYRTEHPDLTVEQAKVLEVAVAVAAKPAAFDPHQRSESELRRLEAGTIAAFGKPDAAALLAALGPQAVPDPRACECSTRSDYCTFVCFFDGVGKCNHYPEGCGTFWAYPCNGCCD